jgi:NAD(P)-dependent dehydrogenase (short-subunit alcohol dehydrogenase family)
MTGGFDLRNRIALVTGASSGLGRAMAVALGAAGARVVLMARRAEALADTAREIDAGPGAAACVPADLSVSERLPTYAAEAAEAFGPPDVLVNAAGVNLRQPVDEVTLADWYLTLNLHLTAPFFLARALVPAMREGGWGRIINLASLQSCRAFPDSLPYGTAKGGVVQMTRAMTQAWARAGITSNAIAPGFFPTELTQPVFADAARAAALAEHTPIGRNGEMRDLAGITCFLASPASDYITGQTLFVDGGFSAC